MVSHTENFRSRVFCCQLARLSCTLLVGCLECGSPGVTDLSWLQSRGQMSESVCEAAHRFPGHGTGVHVPTCSDGPVQRCSPFLV